MDITDHNTDKMFSALSKVQKKLNLPRNVHVFVSLDGEVATMEKNSHISLKNLIAQNKLYLAVKQNCFSSAASNS